LRRLLTGMLIFFCTAALAQGRHEAIPGESVPASPLGIVQPGPVPDAPSRHTRFWDLSNLMLISGMAGTTALDFVATQRNLSGPSGGNEYNPLARVFTGSTPGRVVYFSGAAASTVGLSYLFHKTGHHRLERTTLMLGIGCSTQGAVYSFLHH
jgi:hypothetical protein